MAENEVLDIGNPRHFRRWRKALTDTDLGASEVAECLFEDFSEVLRNKLRGKPLYLVLKACGSDRAALRDVVANFKNREMAKVVEQAHIITCSHDPLVVAEKMTELLIQKLAGRACRDALKSGRIADALERAVSAKLCACRPEIVALLAASLLDKPIPRLRRIAKARPSVQVLLSTSLRPSAG